MITLSTESIVNPSHSFGVAEPCRNCGAPMAADQRYCLACGERRAEMSSVLAGGPPRSAVVDSRPPDGPPRPPGDQGSSQQRNNTLTVIAGVGVLLLAMGVGVLIGRAGVSKSVPAAQVITVGSPAAGATAPVAPESFTSDWASGTSGYTVQLQTLPQAGTQVSAVQAAKTAASAKGAKGVGALKSEEFSSLPAGNYVIYSGVYHKKAEAEKALKGLRKSFPAASVISVANRSSVAGAGSSTGSGVSSGGSGNSLNNPAPPSVLESKPKKGQSYEQKSKNLPNVISTG
ncbi:MAG TPA: zinc ribbon domain-containing protein [Solirubrobacteraceae bacterium]|nr:zinc ribbon domain-containing protein [Solirubrobacteraceae bacterium]